MADQQAVLKTNQGDITLNLFPNNAPETVANFTGLAQGTKDYDAGTDRTAGHLDRSAAFSSDGHKTAKGALKAIGRLSGSEAHGRVQTSRSGPHHRSIEAC